MAAQGTGAAAVTSGKEVDEEAEQDEATASLFVKGLNFATTDDQLRDFFEAVGHVKYDDRACTLSCYPPPSRQSVAWTHCMLAQICCHPHWNRRSQIVNRDRIFATFLPLCATLAGPNPVSALSPPDST